MGSVKDALEINHTLSKLKKGSTITIIGGGSTGISLAGASMDVYDKHYNLRIVEALDSILPGFNKYIVNTAEKILNDNNVEIIKNKKVIDVNKHALMLEDGKLLESDLTIWTGGIKAGVIDIIQDVKKGKQGRIVVDKYSRVIGHDDVFAIGDISLFNLNDGNISPQSAQFAIRQGYQVAKNIINYINYGYMNPIVYNPMGSILSLGRQCIGIINNLPVNGILCNYIEDFITHNYINAIKSRGNSIATLAYENNPLSITTTFMNFVTYMSNKMIYETLHSILSNVKYTERIETNLSIT